MKILLGSVLLSQLLAPVALAAPASPLAGPRAAVAEVNKCVGGLWDEMLVEARAREKRCKHEFPPLSTAFSTKNGDLASLICHGDDDLELYWRCRQAALDRSDDQYCRWRQSFKAAELKCGARPASICVPGNDQSFGSFARLGRALINKEPKAAKLCLEVIGAMPMLGPNGAKGCGLLAAGDVEGACATPGFFKPTDSNEDMSCLFRVGMMLGTSDCDHARLAARPNLQGLCRDMARYRKARDANDPSACGDGPGSLVCRAHFTRDPKVCEPAGARLADESCGRFVKDLSTKGEESAPKRALAREELGALDRLVAPWKACAAAETRARGVIAEATRGKTLAGELRTLEGLAKETDALAAELRLIQPHSLREAPTAPKSNRPATPRRKS